MITTKKLLLASAIAYVTSNLAYSAEDETLRIEKLEAQLQQAMQMIESLSDKVQELKQSEITVVDLTPEKEPLSTSDDIEERIVELENTSDRLQEQVGSRAVVNSFSAERIDLGGFLHSTYTAVNTDLGNTASFNRNIFELLLKADFGENWSVFLAQAFLRQAAPTLLDPATNLPQEPAFNGRPAGVATDTPIAWVNYKNSDAFNVRIGRFLTPHGIINIEHFPALLLDPEQPQFLRPFSGSTIFPNFVNGLELHGQGYFGDNQLSYHLYAAGFAAVDEEPIYGGRLAYEFSNIGLTFGISGSAGSRSEDSIIDSDYQVTGGDILLDNGPILWKSEYYKTSEDLGEDREAYYTQPAVRISDNVTLFYRYDYLDGGQTNIEEQIENVIGASYKPISNINLRLTVTDREFKFDNGTEDYNALIYQFSSSVAF